MKFTMQMFRARGHAASRVALRWEPLVNAEWVFDDGVEIHFRENTEWREAGRKARVFVDSDAPFNLLEDLTNRTRRPHAAFRAPTIEALARIGVTGKLNWSQHAGCSCPCSPGFILTGGPVGGDFWVTLPGAPTVDESKAGREIVFA